MSREEYKSRREFLKKMIAATAVAGVATYIDPATLFASPIPAKMPMRVMGKTGMKVGIYSLGAQATVETPGKEELAVQIVNKAIDLGINYIDTAAAYGRSTPTVSREDARGTSERNVGQVMKYRRKEVYLASKSHDRTYDGTMRLFEKTLSNLQTDYLDLYQIHNIRSSELADIDKFFKDDGVLKAMIKLKDQGVIKNIGITGHEGPDVLNAMIERYDFDNVLVAINAADKHHDPFIEKFLPNAVKQNMGIVGMKIPARDRIFSNGGIISMKEAMDYVLTLPVSTIIIGIDQISELEENIEIARNFKPLTADQMMAIENKTKPHSVDIQFFKNIGEWPPEW